ncbi:MAG: PAS domain-containing protein [Deltaproteobacteria bacterium]|nr:PAS domain-containing protein [Deltaproteobacteria bacterium]MBW2445766.1 PAS domain-containing protein [Deltaproteobacteria bacterium]
MAAGESDTRLHELEEIYRAAPVGLCLVDAEFRFLRINERLAAINGHPAADHIGKTVEEIVPELAEQILPRYRKVLETGHGIENVEVTIPETGHSWLVSDLPVLGDQGHVTGIMTVVQDITALKESEKEVRLGRARLRRAEHVAQLGCWEWNLQTDEMWWSEEYHRIFGREPGSCVPRFDLFIEHIVSEDRGRIREQLETIYAGLDQAQAEFRITTVGGQERTLRAIAMLQRDEDGAPLTLFGTTQDISDEKDTQLSAELERNALEEARRELEEVLRVRTGELDRALDRLRRGH